MPKNGKLPHAPANHVTFHHFVRLFSGFCLTFFAGTMYAFSVIATDMKHAIGLSQKEVGAIGVALHLGVYIMNPISGAVVDRFGARVAVICGGISSAVGFTTVSTVCKHTHHSSPVTVALLVFGFLAVGMGSGLAFVSSVTVAAESSSRQNRGKAVGLMACGFSISSFAISLLYYHLYSNVPESSLSASLSSFIARGGAIVVGVFFAGAWGLTCSRMPPPVASDLHIHEPMHTFHRDSASSATINLSNADIATNTEGFDEWTLRVQSMRTVLGKLIRDAIYWELYFVFLIGAGSGLFVMNNIATMHQALNGGADREAARYLVGAIAIFNSLGRIAIGWFSDTVTAPRSFFLTLCLAGMCLVVFSTTSFGVSHANHLIVTACGMGFTYGGLWCVVPTILSEEYGVANMGKALGLTATAAGLGSTLFNFVASAVYDANGKRVSANGANGNSNNGGGAVVCTGKSCFFGSLVFCGVCLFVATCVSAGVFPKFGRCFVLNADDRQALVANSNANSLSSNVEQTNVSNNNKDDADDLGVSL